MEKIKSSAFFSGLSGLKLPITKRDFPPTYADATRLTYYSYLYNSIELNSTFYKIPQPNTVNKWAGQVGDNFKFTFKLWKGITHRKDFYEEDVISFFEAVSKVGNKKGCILIQFPPSVGNEHLPQLHKLIKCIIKADSEWKIAIEFRNSTWYHDDTYKFFELHKLALVIHDISKCSIPILQHKIDFIYVRFHGPAANYRGSYSSQFLRDFSQDVWKWLEAGKQVFLYFNNTMGDAINNLNTINLHLHTRL